MPIFSLLADPAGYVPCPNNMLTDDAFREHWLEHFDRHFATVMDLALAQYGPSAAERVTACHADFVGTVRRIRARPHDLPRLDLLVMDMLRQERLIAHGLPDPFARHKAAENQACLALYRRVVDELDSHDDAREALLRATEGVFAGNIFDLGAGPTTRMFADASPDFLAVRDGLDGTRPWLVDHFDAMADCLLGRSHRQALFFCDNAGSDFVLGVVPWCRWLAQRGTRVVLAANTLPALNDMTADESRSLLARMSQLDQVLHHLMRDDRLAVIESGGVAPLLDLREVSSQVNETAQGTDLVVLEGMGRAVEANFHARFTVDAVKLAMIKDEMVARRHGGKNFDTVCRFDPA